VSCFLDSWGSISTEERQFHGQCRYKVKYEQYCQHPQSSLTSSLTILGRKDVVKYDDVASLSRTAGLANRVRGNKITTKVSDDNRLQRRSVRTLNRARVPTMGCLPCPRAGCWDAVVSTRSPTFETNWSRQKQQIGADKWCHRARIAALQHCLEIVYTV